MWCAKVPAPCIGKKAYGGIVKRNIRVPRQRMIKHAQQYQLLKGFWGKGSSSYKLGKRRLVKAWCKSTQSRKSNAARMKELYTQRINAASREHRMPYCRLICGLHRDGVWINRKWLAQMALFEPYSFKALTDHAKFVEYGYNCWTEEDYFRMHRTGLTPGGIEPEFDDDYLEELEDRNVVKPQAKSGPRRRLRKTRIRKDVLEHLSQQYKDEIDQIHPATDARLRTGFTNITDTYRPDEED